MSEGDKIRNMEVQPPDAVWNRIEAVLERHPADEMLANRLKEVYVHPPEGAWQRIAASLNTPSIGTNRRPALLRMAAAAMVAGLLFTAAYYLYSNNIATETASAFNTPASAAAIAGSYVEVMNEKGEKIRVSRKVFQLACLKEQQSVAPQEVLKKLGSRECYEQIREWQEQLAHSTMLNSAGGLMDIEQLMTATN